MAQTQVGCCGWSYGDLAENAERYYSLPIKIYKDFQRKATFKLLSVALRTLNNIRGARKINIS
jgi:hypothetical protein